MSKAAAALLALSLFTAGKEPADIIPKISLSVHISGLPADGEAVLKITDLSEGKADEVKLSGDYFQAEVRQGDKYLLSLTDCPAGFMPEAEILITSTESMKDLQKTISVHPFAVRIYQYIRHTDLFAKGGKLELRDESDEVLLEFEPDEDGLVQDEERKEFLFAAGHSYILSQKETAEGCEAGSECLIRIPEFHEADTEPLKFEYFLDEIHDASYPVYDPEPYYEYVREPLIQTVETEPVSEKTEPEKAAETEAEPMIMPAFYIPEIYLPAEEPKHTAKIEKKAERAWFRVRLINEKRQYLAGAEIAVYDAKGNAVETWHSENEDHLVSSDKLRAGETYTVHLITPASGYSASVPDIEHIAVNRTDENWPLIEIIDRPKKEHAVKTETQKTEHKSHGALYASIGAGIGIAGLIGAVLFFSRKQI